VSSWSLLVRRSGLVEHRSQPHNLGAQAQATWRRLLRLARCCGDRPATAHPMLGPSLT
jgi:hypothetical protein